MHEETVSTVFEVVLGIRGMDLKYKTRGYTLYSL